MALQYIKQSHYFSTLVNRPLYTNVLNTDVTEDCILKCFALNYKIPISVCASYVHPRLEKYKRFFIYPCFIRRFIFTANTQKSSNTTLIDNVSSSEIPGQELTAVRLKSRMRVLGSRKLSAEHTSHIRHRNTSTISHSMPRRSKMNVHKAGYNMV
jgi:hypothetical protein